MYVIFLVLICLITRSLYFLTAFIESPPTPPLLQVTTNLILTYNGHVLDTQDSIFYKLQNDHHNKSSYCYHIKILLYFWLYSPHCTSYPQAHLFFLLKVCTSWFLSLYQVPPPVRPRPPVLWQPLVYSWCLYDTVSVLLCLVLCFSDSM